MPGLSKRSHSFTERAINRHVADMLKLYRLAAGLSEQQLADVAGLTLSIIKSHENGIVMIGAGRLFVLAKALGIEPGDFFDGLETYQMHPVRRYDPATMETLSSLRAFHKIANPAIRSAIAALIETAANMKQKP